MEEPAADAEASDGLEAGEDDEREGGPALEGVVENKRQHEHDLRAAWNGHDRGPRMEN